jgi:phospholipase/carboxylesterase
MSQATALVHQIAAARQGGPPHPTLLLLHGRGSNERDLLPLGQAVDPRFFLVSVRAPRRFYAGFDGDGYAWYDSLAPGQPDQASFQDSLALLSRFVDELAQTYPVDPAGLIPLGFSQGAMMANALTLTAPEKVAGAVLLSGFQPALAQLAVRREALRGKPIFAAHGLYDQLLGVEMGRQVRDTLTALETDLTYREYPVEHQVAPAELADINAWLQARLAGSGLS